MGDTGSWLQYLDWPLEKKFAVLLELSCCNTSTEPRRRLQTVKQRVLIKTPHFYVRTVDQHLSVNHKAKTKQGPPLRPQPQPHPTTHTPTQPSGVPDCRGSLIKKTIQEVFQLGKSKVYQGSVDFTAHNDSECNCDVKGAAESHQSFARRADGDPSCQSSGRANCELLDAPTLY